MILSEYLPLPVVLLQLLQLLSLLLKESTLILRCRSHCEEREDPEEKLFIVIPGMVDSVLLVVCLSFFFALFATVRIEWKSFSLLLLRFSTIAPHHRYLLSKQSNGAKRNSYKACNEISYRCFLLS
jgi:hypothetical protein